MRLHLLHLAAALAVLGFAGSQARAVDIYVLSSAGYGTTNSTTGFGKIDSTTGTYTQINGEVSGANAVGNLAWNAANSSFYVTENASTDTNLRTLDVSGSLSSSLGTIGRPIYGMAYRPTDSTLYAWDYNADDTGTINPANGAWSVLNSTPGPGTASPVGGRYAILNDKIYASLKASSGQFGTIGFTASSTFTQIGASDSNYNTMVLASDGTSLYGVYGNGVNGNQKLYSINPTSGAATFMNYVAGTGLGVFFSGAGMSTSVPEPSTYALAAIATGVMAYVARRRKGRQA